MPTIPNAATADAAIDDAVSILAREIRRIGVRADEASLEAREVDLLVRVVNGLARVVEIQTDPLNPAAKRKLKDMPLEQIRAMRAELEAKERGQAS